MKWKYDEYLGERFSRYGNHFAEHKKVVYLYALKRTFSVSWVWATDSFGRRSYTPFSQKTISDFINWRIGYLKLFISTKRKY